VSDECCLTRPTNEGVLRRMGQIQLGPPQLRQNAKRREGEAAGARAVFTFRKDF